MKVKVSICIPTYNEVYFLKKNLESILKQTFLDYEVIISDDSTSNIVKDLIENFNFSGKLKYFQNFFPKGSPANWNATIDMAEGEYIKLMHHDDWFSTETSLEKLVSLIRSSNASFVFSGCNNISAMGELLFQHCMTDEEAAIVKSAPEYLFYNNRIGAPSVTLFRKCDLRFDINIKYLVDIEFYIQLIYKWNEFAFIPDKLVNIGHGPSQITNSVIGSPKLIVYEHLYAYYKLDHNKMNFRWYFKTFWNLEKRYGLINYLDYCLTKGIPNIPPFIYSIIKVKKFIKRVRLSKIEKIIGHILYLKCLANGYYPTSGRAW